LQSVTFSADFVHLEDLDKLVAIINEHNSKYNNNKVRDGACLVDRMILGKCWLIKDDIKVRTKGGKWCSGTGSGALKTWMPQVVPTL